MPAYSFTVERSAKPEDQLDGLIVGLAVISGDFGAANENDAWQTITKLCCVPGVWICHLRSGNQKFKGRRIRVPQRAEATR